jgi:hypothetical protein
MTDSNFWASRLSAEQAPAPEFPRADGAAYRAHRRLTSGSRLYDEPVAPVQRAIYDPEARQPTLEERANAPRPSKWEQKLGQSDVDYVSKLRPQLQHLAAHLPAAELERVAGQYNAAVTRLESGVGSHEQLRESLNAKTEGTGIGIMGAAHDRAAAWGVRHDSRQVEANGALAMQAGTIAPGAKISSADAYALARAREAEQRGLVPLRTTPPQGSTGDGWMAR